MEEIVKKRILAAIAGVSLLSGLLTAATANAANDHYLADHGQRV